MSRLNMKDKINDLKSQGWTVVSYGERRINNRYYKYCLLEKDGQKIVVNHQGGTDGLISNLG